MATGITNTITSGVNTSFSDELNENFNEVYAGLQIYTGSDFNATRANSTGTTSNNHTLQISSGKIKRYVKINVTVSVTSNSNASGSSAAARLVLETAENGGGFTSRFSSSLCYSAGSDSGSQTNAFTVTFFYEPTSGEMTNGLDIKLTGEATVNHNSGSTNANITNLQTVLEYF